MWPSSATRRRAEPRPARRLAAALAAAVLAVPGGVAHATAGAALPPPGDAAAEPLLLAVRLNGVDRPDDVAVLRVAGGLALPPEAWAALGLEPPTAAPGTHPRSGLLRLDAVPGLRWRVDEPSQTLIIDAPAAAFAASRIGLDGAAPVARPAAAFGGYANYDLQWQRSGGADGRAASNALIELGSFGGGGSGRLSGLLRDGAALPGWVRLDTAWTVDQPGRLASLRVGDAIGKAGAWGRSLRYGGLQWATDFSVQPGFLSFPLPTLRGEAMLPSTVDLYVNNSQRLQQAVPAGAFDLSEVPIVTGQGEVRMVVRDLLGREQVVVQPYYVSPALLRPGLRAQAFELGWVREDYGLASQRYGRPLATATDRLGISERYTRELRAELLEDRIAAGATGIWLLPALGTVNLSAVGSRTPDARGAMAALGADRQALDWSGSLQGRWASRGFTQLGQADNAAPRFTLSAALGGSWAGVGVGVGLLQRSLWQGERERIVSFNASRNVGRFGALGLFLLRDLQRGGYALSLNLSQALDAHTSASATTLRRREAGSSGDQHQLQLQRNLPAGPGFGYQLASERGEVERDTAQAAWHTEQAVFSAGLARRGDQQDARAGVAGGLAWLGSSVFASRRIDGSFAVVDVGGYPGVQLLHDNRPVARTDARGRALVAGLRGYEANRIAVDPANLPFDAEVDALEVVLTPPARSGVALSIPVRRARAASFRLVGADGRALPPGSELRIAGQQRAFVVGYEGRAFVSGLAVRTEVVARWPGHECRAWLPAAAAADPDELLPELGTLHCL